MDITRNIDFELFRRDVRPRSIVSIAGLVLAVGVGEAFLFLGEVSYAVWAYSLLLVALSLVPLLYERDTPVVLAFALVAVFRLVSLAMPVFAERTLFWLPVVYGPFVPVFGYLGWRTARDGSDAPRPLQESDEETETETAPSPPAETGGLGRELPRWLGGERGGKLRWLLGRVRRFLALDEAKPATEHTVREWVTRGVVVVFLPLAAVVLLASLFLSTVYLAELEYGLIAPPALVTSLGVSELALLAVVMVGFVGFVEEFLFRGLLQNVLERRLGVVPGLVLASGVYGLVHSVYGEPTMLLFTAGVGLAFGLVYDVTDSLVLVSFLHGLGNVFLFGVIPLGGPSSAALLELVVDRGSLQIGLAMAIDTVPVVELSVLAPI